MSNKVYTYIEIKEHESGNVIKRKDVSELSPNKQDSIERGMNINLNHEKYYTFSFDSENKLEIIN